MENEEWWQKKTKSDENNDNREKENKSGIKKEDMITETNLYRER